LKYYKDGLKNSFWDLEINSYSLINKQILPHLKLNSVILPMLNSANISNILLGKFASTSWSSATSRNAWFRNFKIYLPLVSHRLKLYTANDTCWKLHRLLIYLLFWILLPRNFDDANCYWYWTSIGTNQYK